MKFVADQWRCLVRMMVLLTIIICSDSVHAALVASGVSSNNTSDGTIVGAVSNVDLGAAGTATGANGFFGTAAELNNGAITPGTGSLYLPQNFGSSTKLPETYTIALDVVTRPQGYDVTSITTFAGWTQNGPQLGNQKYALSISTVSAPGIFVPMGTFEYIPFNDNTSSGGSVTQMTVADNGGALIGTGVHSIRLEFLDHGFSGPNTAVDGTVYYEVDINGHATGSSPAEISVSSPGNRQLVQRNSENKASIAIQGSYLNAPESIEARAVVMVGPSNSGATTAWQTIDPAPAGGNFSGTLTDVAAGGWYQLEVRPVTGGAPGTTAIIQKVGVGDIYVTAGQSNSANHGNPTLVPASDRVVSLSAYGGSNWRHGYDPQPLATGAGGSVWSRLGDLLVAAENIPVGFVAVGVGGSALSAWQPGTGNYNSRLKAAVQSFPANGFRACLWHQGESDAINNVTASAHANQLAAMITQSRIDAGWVIPWYIAEAAFHPNTNLGQEEPVVAGQRLAVTNDSNVFLGPSTDEFHLENSAGGKLTDAVHFNASGLLDHATQWKNILLGTTFLQLENGDFENNTSSAYTTASPLVDGGISIVSLTSNASPSVLNWRVLSATGISAADGVYGYYNPDAGFYTDAVDTVNGGVMANMSGKHVAFFSGGSAGNYFLQITRANLQPDKTYDFSVSLGIRNNGNTFAGAKLEILGNGQVLAAKTFTQADLDALAGGSAIGKFTVAKISYTTGATVASNQLISVRISKVNAGGYLDMDDAKLSSELDLGAIWFIGDSITQSNADGSSSSSPRKELYDLLVVNTNVTFSYTGHFTANVDGLPSSGGTAATNLYHYHSGISGSVIGFHPSNGGRTDMTTNIDSGQNFWTSGRLATVKPNIILIMLGTNDMGADIGVATAPARISTLIDKIMAQPGVGDPAIFVAAIPPNRIDFPTKNNRVLAFNAALPDVVDAQRGLGRDVYLVDNYNPVNDDYANTMRSDNLHTNALGNEVMAQQWYDAIFQRFSPSDTASFSAWQFANFGSSLATDAAFGQDPDADGQNNLYEFVFGSDPNSNSATAHPLTFDGTTAVITRRIASGAGVSYILEESATLQNGSWTTVTNVTSNVTSTSGHFETVEITKDSGHDWSPGNRNFIRVRVVMNP